MTIAEAAQLYQVKPQAIYNRITRNGMRLQDLTQEGTSSLTAEGEAKIAEWFKDGKKNIVTQRIIELEKASADLNKQILTLQHETETVKAERDELINTVTQQKQEISVLQDKLAEKDTEVNFLRLTLSNEQQQNKQILAMLQPAQTEKGLFARIRAAFTTKKGD